jgi:hypothetical protein
MVQRAVEAWVCVQQSTSALLNELHRPMRHVPIACSITSVHSNTFRVHNVQRLSRDARMPVIVYSSSQLCALCSLSLSLSLCVLLVGCDTTCTEPHHHPLQNSFHAKVISVVTCVHPHTVPVCAGHTHPLLVHVSTRTPSLSALATPTRCSCTSCTHCPSRCTTSLLIEHAHAGGAADTLSIFMLYAVQEGPPIHFPAMASMRAHLACGYHQSTVCSVLTNTIASAHARTRPNVRVSQLTSSARTHATKCPRLAAHQLVCCIFFVCIFFAGGRCAA